MKLNINTDAAVKYTNQLEKMGRSAFPNAVRGALNKAAFETKKDSLLKSAKKEFVHREPNFFKANSRVEMAKGWNVNEMHSTVGFVSTGLKGQKNQAVEDLEDQESGGIIGGRSFIPMKPARISNNNSKKVKVNYRLSKIKNVVNANNVNATSQKQKFIRAAIMAKKLYGNNAFVLGNSRGGKMILSRIDEVSSNLKTRGLKIKRTPLYSYEKGFKAKVRGTDFAKRAAYESGLRISDWYIAEARRQFEKLQKG